MAEGSVLDALPLLREELALVFLAAEMFRYLAAHLNGFLQTVDDSIVIPDGSLQAANSATNQ